jgi:oligopeptide/dipeptide ABC transporter ATP-binding protein
MTLLSVQDLVVRFRTHDATVYAVNGVSFEIDAGETLGLVGESGCGKSVTSLAITRLLPAPAGRVEGGDVLLEGKSLLSLTEREMNRVRGTEIAMVFQDPLTSLNPVLTIGSQITEGILAHQDLTKAQARARAIDLLAMVGIADGKDRLRAYPHQLSGGMRQRVMIAIALSLQPKLLIADEPTTALDVTIQAQVIDLIKELTRKSGTAALIITHDLGVVADMTQRTCVMYAGYLVETASTPDLFARPRHPYTIGLLNSVSRIDQEAEALRPIEGAPPEQTQPPKGCPFAPRCAWRLPVCWDVNPLLLPEVPGPTAATTDPGVRHLVACHNPANADEVAVGRPLRQGFVAAPNPALVASAG